MLHALEQDINNLQPDPASLVDFIPQLTTDDALLKALSDNLESLDLKSSESSVTQWLSSSPAPYVYNDVNPSHPAKDISTYPTIMQLLSLINENDKVTGPLDSCLVMKYSSSSVSLSPHNDDESHIDQSKSICSFTLGASRTLDFLPCTKYQTRSNKKKWSRAIEWTRDHW